MSEIWAELERKGGVDSSSPASSKIKINLLKNNKKLLYYYVPKKSSNVFQVITSTSHVLYGDIFFQFFLAPWPSPKIFFKSENLEKSNEHLYRTLRANNFVAIIMIASCQDEWRTITVIDSSIFQTFFNYWWLRINK